MQSNQLKRSTNFIGSNSVKRQCTNQAIIPFFQLEADNCARFRFIMRTDEKDKILVNCIANLKPTYCYLRLYLALRSDNELQNTFINQIYVNIIDFNAEAQSIFINRLLYAYDQLKVHSSKKFGLIYYNDLIKWVKLTREWTVLDRIYFNP
jgi:hypothetical protein